MLTTGFPGAPAARFAARFDPLWPFEIPEIIEITGPPGDLFIRRL
jgi:hypothetical protein